MKKAPYEKFELNSDNFADAARIQFYRGALDAYCVDCKCDSVFRSTTGQLIGDVGIRDIEFDVAFENDDFIFFPGAGGGVKARNIDPLVRTDRIFDVRFACSRAPLHFMAFLVRVTPTTISKVGQTPSIADLENHRIKKYRRLLGDEKWIEFSKAIGLKAHGVGIGSFVYLRRVFELVIDRARAEAEKAPGWNAAACAEAKPMDQKIEFLKDRLPVFLYRNRRIYRIFGKGIHELGDDECLALFDPLQVGIELILDEEIERSERAKKLKEAQTALDLLDPGGANEPAE